MTDIMPTPLTTVPEIYAAAFNRQTAALSTGLRFRLSRSRAVLVRSKPTISIGKRCISTVVETIFEQARPFVWQFHSQIIDIDRSASAADQQTIRTWSTQRRKTFESPNGPRLAPIIAMLASTLEFGREGKDFILLSRVPLLS